MIYLLIYGVGRLFGAFSSLADLTEPVLLMGGSGKTALPILFLAGRGLSVLLGVATAVLTFDLGRRITGLVLGGVLAGLWVAVSPTLIANSRFLIPDGPLTFCTTLVIWAAWRSYQAGRTRDYLLAGVALGLAVGLKYNAAVFALAIVLAHFLRGLARNRGLAVVCRGRHQPHRFRGNHTVRHPGFPNVPAGRVHRHPSLHRRACREHGEFADLVPGLPLAKGGPYAPAGRCRTLWGAYKRSRGAILVAATTLAYLLFISAFAVHFERTALPLIPLFAVLAAYFLVSLLPAQASDRKGVQFGAAALFSSSH